MPIKPPTHFNAIARNEWHRIIGLLKSRGLFDELRMASIEGYCTHYARFVTAEKNLAKATDQGEIDRWLAISGTASRKVRDFSRDLGIPIAVQARGPKAETKAEPTAETHEKRMLREVGDALAGWSPVQ